MTPEGKIKARLKRALKPFGNKVYQFWPVQTGYGTKTLDCLLCVAGQFIAIETKAPGKKLTALQEQTAIDICAANGLAFKVDGDESIDRVIGHLIKIT